MVLRLGVWAVGFIAFLMAMGVAQRYGVIWSLPLAVLFALANAYAIKGGFKTSRTKRPPREAG